MLLDIRTYRCKPGKIKEHLDLYEKKKVKNHKQKFRSTITLCCL